MSKITIKNKDWKIIKQIDLDVNKILISQIIDSWVEVDFACNTGICWACMMKIESWEENIIKNKKTEPAFDLWKNEVMTCIAWVKSLDWDIVLRKIY